MQDSQDFPGRDLWLGQTAPRYTSYPPAPFFKSDVTGERYRQSLLALPASVPLSIYIHIPFCHKLCLYCGCNTAVTRRIPRIERYLASLKNEMTIAARTTGFRKVENLHMGGGTPNILSAGAMEDLFLCLNRAFDLRSLREKALELDPRYVDEDQVKIMADYGVNRVSLGIQDFDPEVQRAVRRIQSYDTVARLCDLLRKHGINRINFDLMYGLPFQTPESVLKTAQRVCSLVPDRLALFSYAHVPGIKKHQRVLERFGLPNHRQKLAMDEAARTVLMNHGYVALGIDHFAKAHDTMTLAFHAGKLRRSFQGYTEDETAALIGFGASSISQTPDGYFQNERNEGPYEAHIDSGDFATSRGFLLSAQDRLRRAIIEQLMCYLTCDIEKICKTYGISPEAFDGEIKALFRYEEAGLIARRGYNLSLLSPHRMAIRVICRIFDQYTPGQSSLSSSRVA